MSFKMLGERTSIGIGRPDERWDMESVATEMVTKGGKLA